MKIVVKPGVSLVWIRQCPLFTEDKRESKLVIELLIQEG